MNDTKQALEAVVALVEKATPGEWSICDGPVGYAHRIYSEAMPDELEVVCDVTHGKDASLVTAAANLIRTHGPALQSALEQVEQLQAALGEAERDRERVDWLERAARSTGIFLYNGVDTPGERKFSPGLGLRPGRMDRTLREAVDQANAGGTKWLRS